MNISFEVETTGGISVVLKNKKGEGGPSRCACAPSLSWNFKGGNRVLRICPLPPP